MNNFNKPLFNTFASLPNIPYNIVVHLAKDPKADNLFKLLKYNDYDALGKPNLSLQEKLSLVWKNDPDQNKYNIFFTQMVENEQTEERTLLKIYKYTTSPENAQTAVVSYEFDILTGGKITMVEYNGYPCSRLDVAEAILLESLNGIDVNGVGYFQFNQQLSRLDRSYYGIGNNTNFTGHGIIMSVMVSDLSNAGC